MTKLQHRWKNRNRSFRKSSWKSVLSFAILFLLSANSFAQQVLKGKILDERTKEPILGVNIRIKGENGVTTSGQGGDFSIRATNLPVTLLISSIDYKKQEIDVYEAVPTTILLTEDLNKLKQVVVVGYGTQKRKELTGAISSVSKASLASGATSFDKLLGGSVSGLNVSQSDGQPGATFNIRIRGGNSINAGNEPLFVVDGVILYNDNSSTQTGISRSGGKLNPLAALNPGDIESIEVLKDVSATAIYGSRGSNGVILVTTKSGKKGKTNVEYQLTSGRQKVSRKLDLMNAREWGELYLDIASPTNISETGLTREKVQTLGAGTDWQDAALRTARTGGHQLTISGGDDKSRFLLSGNYSNQDGILLNTNFKRYSGRFNYERDIQKYLTVGVNVAANKLQQNGLSDYGSLYVNGISNPLDYVLRIPQVVDIYNQNGKYNYNNLFEKGDLRLGNVTVNAISDLVNTVSETRANSILGNFYAKYTILPSLVAKVNLGTNLVNTTQNYFAPASSAPGFLSRGYGSVGNKTNDSWQAEYTLNYSKQLSKNHYIDVLAGYTTQKTSIEYAVASSTNFSNEQLSYHNLQGGSTLISPSSGGSESILNSYLGRVNYSLLGRYNVTGTLRADGSSRFAENHKWGYFPSLGFSWNVNDEPFLKGNKTLSNLKLRASLGTVGNQEIGDYRYESTYSVIKYSFNGRLLTAYARGNAENPDLKWEKTAQYNLGADLGLWDDRLTFVADAYYKNTSDLLLDIPVEVTTGFNSMLKNVGSVTNKGLEFAVNGNLIERKNLNWNVSANIARNINEVTNLGGLEYIVSGNTIVKKGEPLGSFYGVVFDGIVQSGDDLQSIAKPSWKPTVEPGDVKYVNQGTDKEITQDLDRVVLGSNQPDFIYGFSTTLKYKSVSLFASLQGSQGNKVYNALRQDLETPTTSYNVSRTLLDRWTPENPSNSVPKASVTSSTWLDSRYIEDASFLKLKNVTLSYDLPVKFKAASSPKFRIFATGQNLLTLTRYKGYDPEVASGTDAGAYPSAKTFTFGLNVSY